MPTLPIVPAMSGYRHRGLRPSGSLADNAARSYDDTHVYAANNAGAAFTFATLAETLERNPCFARNSFHQLREKSTPETMPAVSMELKAFTARQFGAARAGPYLEGGSSTAPAAALAREGAKGSPPTGPESVTNYSAAQPAVDETSSQAEDEESAEGSTHHSDAAISTETRVSARTVEGLLADSIPQSRPVSSRVRSSSSRFSLSSEAAASAEALAQSPRATTDDTATAVAAAPASQYLSAFSSPLHARSPENEDGAGFPSHIAPPPTLRRAVMANSEIKSKDFVIGLNLFDDEVCNGDIDDGISDGDDRGKNMYESIRSTGESDQGATAYKNSGVLARGRREGIEPASTSGWDRGEARFSCSDAVWVECPQEGTRGTREKGDYVADQNNGRRRVAALFGDDDDGGGRRGMNIPLRWSTGGTVDVNGDKKIASGFRSPRVARRGDDTDDRQKHGWRNPSVDGGDGGGDGHRTPPRATSRSSSGSPGLTPLRGRSRRGWWRRRRDSYPTEA